EKLGGGVPAFSVSPPLVNSNIRAFGFPVASEISPRRATDRERSRMRLVPTVTTGSVVKINTDEKEGQTLVHQAPVSNGAWGGPIVNSCNEVVGLNYTQSVERIVKAEGVGKATSKNTGRVEVGTMEVPTSNLVGAIGANELVTFAALSGIELPTVNT